MGGLTDEQAAELRAEYERIVSEGPSRGRGRVAALRKRWGLKLNTFYMIVHSAGVDRG
jgi:hypothetical protein